MTLFRTGFAALAIVALLTLPVRASLIDGNFESPNLAQASPAYVALTLAPYGWNEVEDVGPNSSTGIIRPMLAGETPVPIAPSNNVAFLQLANEYQASAAIWQPIVAAMQPRTIYTIHYDVGNRNVPFNTARDSDSLFRAMFIAGSNGGILPYYATGGMTFKTLAPGATGEFYQIGDIPDGQWMTDQTISIDTTLYPSLVGQQLNIEFRLDREAMAGPILVTRQVSEVYLDNVTSTALPSNLQPENSLPEPSSFVLLGCSALGMLGWRRKQVIRWMKMARS